MRSEASCTDPQGIVPRASEGEHVPMSENAGKIGGSGFGIGSGIGGALLLWYLNVHYQACGSSIVGPKQNFWDPPVVPPLGSTQFAYCEPALGGDAAALLPWVLAVVLGGAGLLIGMGIDAREARIHAAPPSDPAQPGTVAP